jgi:hydroxypyruvate reductase
MQTGLHAVEGRRCVSAALRAEPPVGPVWVAAVGKAAPAMAAGAHEALGPRVQSTLVIARDALPPAWPVPAAAAEVLYGAHPLPDQRSLDAGARLLAWVDALPPGVQPLFLISGGASSLVEVLRAGVTLAELQELNRAALAEGLPIGEFNARRIRISRIKGGQLAQRLNGRAGRALFISDVPGDDAAVIGSGILGPPPAGPDCIQRCVVASVDAAVAAVAARGRELGLTVHAPVRRFDDSAPRLAARFAHELSLTPAQLCVWGGESTLMLPAHPGRGGRNQHLALAAARLIAGHPDLMLLAVGTDGSDGVTDDAGALVDAESCSRLTLAHLDADVCLRNADSAAALSASGDLVHTGPTGTNVGDLVIGLKLSAAGARSLPQLRGGEPMRVL